MIHSLENEHLLIGINEKGAELSNLVLKKSGREYLWQGDPNFWPRQAPVLFPMTGRLKDNAYTFEGKTYPLHQHGFARDMDFDLMLDDENEMGFSLSFNKETLKAFPFKFEFLITYRLENSTLHIGYEVVNSDTKPLFFSVGAHPAFNWPLDEYEKFEDYYLEFDQVENLQKFDLKDGLIEEGKISVAENTKILKLNHSLFKADALFFEGLKSSCVSMISAKTGHGLKMDFTGFPYLGLWTKNDAPFLCIEPWHGIADEKNRNSELESKKGIQRLEAGKSFQCEYAITLF